MHVMTLNDLFFLVPVLTRPRQMGFLFLFTIYSTVKIVNNGGTYF